MARSLDLNGLTFDDIQLLPAYSEVESRRQVNTTALLTVNHSLGIPIIAAPMDTVCGWEMMQTLHLMGGIGCLHRFMTIEKQRELISRMQYLHSDRFPPLTMLAVGATGDWQERLESAVSIGTDIIVIDVAHGDHIHVKRAMKIINKMSTRSQFDIVLGNVATADGARRLQDWGADALRVGIGGGSACSTRLQTGIGVPQLQAISDVVSVAKVPVISDGGARYPGDVCKALAAGADTVMLGGMLAGSSDAAGEIIERNGKQYKLFRGSASASQKAANGAKIEHVEGATGLIEYKGKTHVIIESIMDGVRSCMSYLGVSNLRQMAFVAEFVRITNAGLNEAHPHGVEKHVMDSDLIAIS